MRPDFFRTFVPTAMSERKTGFLPCHIEAERYNIMGMEKSHLATSQIWHLTIRAMLYSATFTIAIPAMVFAFMIQFGMLDSPARYHGIMNYFIMMMCSALVFYGILDALKWRRAAQLRALFLAALFGSVWSMSGIDMEYLLAVCLFVLVSTGAVKGVAARRRLGMIVAFSFICLGATVVHHVVLLSTFTNPITHSRMVDLGDRVLDRTVFETSCAQRTRFELCETFDDRFAEGFTTRTDFLTTMASIREEFQLSGEAVSKASYDKNDDIPVWAFGYDGSTWRILMSHDDLYTQRVVPAMGLLWWLSVIVWTSLGTMTITWHELGDRQQRRSTLFTHLSVYGMACAISSILICAAALLGRIGFFPAISSGDWTRDALVQFWHHLASIAIIIPFIWVTLGVAIFIAHKWFARHKA